MELLRRHVRSSGVALILTLAVMASVQCLLTADMTAAQQACCAAMGHNCGATATDKTCCSSGTPRVDALSAAKRVALSVPAAIVMHVAAVDITPPHAAAARAPRVDAFAAGPPGVPAYLLNSTFRI